MTKGRKKISDASKRLRGTDQPCRMCPRPWTRAKLHRAREVRYEYLLNFIVHTTVGSFLPERWCKSKSLVLSYGVKIKRACTIFCHLLYYCYFLT